jgi:uncharacterized membrane protein YphA (DoxX/SURF4 family)
VKDTQFDLRRLAAVVVAITTLMAALIIGMSSADASSPYPPIDPCGSSASSSTGVDGQSTCHGVGAQSTARTVPSTEHTDATASTGFDSLMASLVAGVLLIGGGALVVAGRQRRRHS